VTFPVQASNRLFSTCKYSAFLSYAEADDGAWASWITNFWEEFDLALRSRVLGVKVPNSHLSARNGPVQGPLGVALRTNIAASFAMVLFVHDGYVVSEWCLEELKYFKDLFGDSGFRDRLYIIAMSKGAMETLRRKSIWTNEFTGPNQLIWMPFYQDNSDDQPLEIYAAGPRKGKTVVSSDFWTRFVRLRDDLALKIKRQVADEEFVPTYPLTSTSRTPAPNDEIVRVYIEGKEQHRYWETLGQQVVQSWDQVVALEHIEPPLRLRPTGLPLSELAQRPILDDANGVVLLWGRKTPDSLAAQISQVEPKLSGPHFAPGLIAYMMQGVDDMPGSTTINNWPVVRFATRSDETATVLADDGLKLATFLKRVLAHKRRT
jgi:hypothetical protein